MGFPDPDLANEASCRSRLWAWSPRCFAPTGKLQRVHAFRRCRLQLKSKHCHASCSQHDGCWGNIKGVQTVPDKGFLMWPSRVICRIRVLPAILITSGSWCIPFDQQVATRQRRFLAACGLSSIHRAILTTCGCFHKWGVHFLDVLIMRALCYYGSTLGPLILGNPHVGPGACNSRSTRRCWLNVSWVLFL